MDTQRDIELYAAHLELYRMTLVPLMNLLQEDIGTPPWLVDFEYEDVLNAIHVLQTDNKLKLPMCSSAGCILPHKKDCTGRCATDLADAALASYKSLQHEKQHLFYMRQHLCEKTDESPCPFYSRAIAHPEDIAQWILKSSPDFAVRGLQQLLANYLERFVLDQFAADTSILLELAYQITAPLPQEMTQPLACNLLGALQKNYIDIFKLQGSTIVKKVATQLDMTPEEVDEVAGLSQSS